MWTKDSPARRLRLAILNDTPQVLTLLCDWARVHNDTDDRALVGQDRVGRQLALACRPRAGLVLDST